MNRMQGLLALLLVIALAVISIAMPLFISVYHVSATAAKAPNNGSDFNSALTSGLQEPPGDYVLRLSSMCSAKSNSTVWRLTGLLMATFITLSLLALLCIGSAHPTKKETRSIFLVSWHILRAPPARA